VAATGNSCGQSGLHQPCIRYCVKACAQQLQQGACTSSAIMQRKKRCRRGRQASLPMLWDVLVWLVRDRAAWRLAARLRPSNRTAVSWAAAARGEVLQLGLQVAQQQQTEGPHGQMAANTPARPHARRQAGVHAAVRHHNKAQGHYPGYHATKSSHRQQAQAALRSVGCSQLSRPRSAAAVAGPGGPAAPHCKAQPAGSSTS